MTTTVITVADLNKGLDEITDDKAKRRSAIQKFNRAVAAGKSPDRTARQVLEETAAGFANSDQKLKAARKAAGLPDFDLPEPAVTDAITYRRSSLERPDFSKSVMLAIIGTGVGLGAAMGLTIAAFTAGWYSELVADQNRSIFVIVWVVSLMGAGLSAGYALGIEPDEPSKEEKTTVVSESAETTRP